MARLTRCPGLWIGFFVLLFLLPGRGFAQAAATVRCRLEAAEMLAGAENRLIIEVLDVQNFYGYQLEVLFPPGQIQLLDENPAQSEVNLSLGSFLSPDFVVLNQADLSTGLARLAVVQVSPAQARSGTGELASARFQAPSAGAFSFVLNNVILSDQEGNAIPHNLEGCSLVVNDAVNPDDPQPTQPEPAPEILPSPTTSAAGPAAQPAGTDAPAVPTSEASRPAVTSTQAQAPAALAGTPAGQKTPAAGGTTAQESAGEPDDQAAGQVPVETLSSKPVEAGIQKQSSLPWFAVLAVFAAALSVWIWRRRLS